MCSEVRAHQLVLRDSAPRACGQEFHPPVCHQGFGPTNLCSGVPPTGLPSGVRPHGHVLETARWPHRCLASVGEGLAKAPRAGSRSSRPGSRRHSCRRRHRPRRSHPDRQRSRNRRLLAGPAGRIERRCAALVDLAVYPVRCSIFLAKMDHHSSLTARPRARAAIDRQRDITSVPRSTGGLSTGCACHVRR